MPIRENDREACVGTVCFASLFALTSVTVAGNLNPPAGPVAPVMLPLDQIEPRTPISALPFTINQCGSYFLTNCLTGVAGAHGISVQADDVTIDLNGFTLSGVPGSLDGINVSVPSPNVKIENGNINDWDQGISCFDGSLIVRNVVIEDVATAGIFVSNCFNVDLQDIVVRFRPGTAGVGILSDQCNMQAQNLKIRGRFPAVPGGEAITIIGGSAKIKTADIRDVGIGIKSIPSGPVPPGPATTVADIPGVKTEDIRCETIKTGLDLTDTNFGGNGIHISAATLDGIDAKNFLRLNPAPIITTTRLRNVFIRDVGGNGINFIGGSMNIEFSEVRRAGGHGVNGQEGSFASEGLAVFSVQRGLQFLESPLVELKASEIGDAALEGISVRVSATDDVSIKITDGIVHDCGGDGLSVVLVGPPPPLPVPARLFIDGLRTERCVGAGLRIDAPATGVISGCQSSGNAFDGIFIGPPVTGLRLEDNSVVGNNTGIVVQGLNNLIIGNSASNNPGGDFIIFQGNADGPVVNIINIGANCNPAANYRH